MRAMAKHEFVARIERSEIRELGLRASSFRSALALHRGGGTEGVCKNSEINPMQSDARGASGAKPAELPHAKGGEIGARRKLEINPMQSDARQIARVSNTIWRTHRTRPGLQGIAKQPHAKGARTAHGQSWKLTPCSRMQDKSRVRRSRSGERLRRQRGGGQKSRNNPMQRGRPGGGTKSRGTTPCKGAGTRSGIQVYKCDPWPDLNPSGRRSRPSPPRRRPAAS